MVKIRRLKRALRAALGEPEEEGFSAGKASGWFKRGGDSAGPIHLSKDKDGVWEASMNADLISLSGPDMSQGYHSGALVSLVNHWLLKVYTFQSISRTKPTWNTVRSTLQYQHIPQPVPEIDITVPQCPQGEDPFMDVDSDGQAFPPSFPIVEIQIVT
ncbi:hypothetical protein C8J56DRAFT_1113064 [Mycena floridula]|nr:hypothetical protein C8J56DRAFT_1113064 [Mycena floridula]